METYVLTMPQRPSPEQAEHEHVRLELIDPRRDIFRCLGCGVEVCSPELAEYMKFCGASE